MPTTYKTWPGYVMDATTIITLLLAVYTGAAWAHIAFAVTLTVLLLCMLLAFVLFFFMANHPSTRNTPIMPASLPQRWHILTRDALVSLMLAVYVNFALGLGYYAGVLLFKTLVRQHNLRILAHLRRQKG